MKRAGILMAIAAALVVSGGASALAAAPTATTNPATNVTATTATLNGTVSPNGDATTYHFEYGTTTAYGARTPDQALNGNASKSVDADVTGLRPSTTYHYRLVATNASGTVNGADVTFATPVAPVSITASPRTVTFGRATTISGKVNGPDGPDSQVELQSTPFPFTDPFKPIATGTADQAGNYTFGNQRPTVNTRYQVRAKTKPPVTSPFVTVRVRPAITLRLNDRTPRRGQRVRFSGEVTPAHNGKVVLIQRHTSKGWKTVTTPTLRATTAGTNGVARSRYSRRIRIRRSGTYRTVFRPGDGDHVRGVSAKRRARVH